MSKNIQSSNYHKYYQDYHNFLIAKNYRGIGKYLTAVKEFLVFMEERQLFDMQQMKPQEVIAYYEHLISRPNKRYGGTLSDSSIKNHLFALTLFFDNLLEWKVIQKAVSLPKYRSNNSQSRTILSEKDIQLLYEATQTKLERAFLSVAYGCGLRRMELQRLNMPDILISTGMLIVRSGKGSKRREVPMSDAVLEDVKDYLLNERYSLINPRNPKVEAFFINKVGTRLRGDSMNRKLKDLIKRTNNSALQRKTISLHCLRHSIAHHLLDREASIEFVRDFLGHSFMDTTHLYAIRRKRKHKMLSR